jgi:hypothetical protein
MNTPGLECLGSCPSTHYTDALLCLPCPEKCLTCSSNKQCLICAQDYLAISKTDLDCIEDCPTSYYKEDGQCLACPSICATCSSSTQCLSCTEQGYLPVQSSDQAKCYKKEEDSIALAKVFNSSFTVMSSSTAVVSPYLHFVCSLSEQHCEVLGKSRPQRHHFIMVVHAVSASFDLTDSTDRLFTLPSKASLLIMCLQCHACQTQHCSSCRSVTADEPIL